MHRSPTEQSFVDALLPAQVGRNAKLERIDRLVDWDRLAQLVNGIYASTTGRPSYPPVLLVKILVLQQWYNASDEAIEEALWDRISFKRFVGLGIEDAAPDHSTISRFRKEVSSRGLGKRLFAELGRQLDARGLLVKAGTLLNATIVEAQTRRPPPVRRGSGNADAA